MSSPPSLDSLKISDEVAFTQKPAVQPSTSTPSEEKAVVNGDAKESGSAEHVENTSSPNTGPSASQPSSASPAFKPTPSTAPQRPSPQQPAASAPTVPGRIGAARGGMQGPMGMGMRGRGGPSRAAPALPPSLQAKMDKVSIVYLKCMFRAS